MTAFRAQFYISMSPAIGAHEQIAHSLHFSFAGVSMIDISTNFSITYPLFDSEDTTLIDIARIADLIDASA